MSYGRRLLTVVPALLVTVLAFALPGAAAGEPLPATEEVMNHFRDDWGRHAKDRYGLGRWNPVSEWERVEQYGFAAGSDEFTGRPERVGDLKPVTLRIMSRQVHGRTEYNVIERVTEPDGTVTENPLPVFAGTPEDMVFHNAAGIHTGPGGEAQETCREFAKAGRRFQLCRVLFQDDRIAYHTKIEKGSAAEGLPTVDELLGAFRDLWGRTRFTPTGTTAWRESAVFRSERLIVFGPPGSGEPADELTGEPRELTPGEEGTAQVDWVLYRRTVRGRAEHMVADRATVRGERTISYFQPFRGSPDHWLALIDDPAPGDPTPGHRYHGRALREFLIVRASVDRGEAHYWVARPLPAGM
ncbi:hypothetical protein [Bailinhaonella thermotolerans]|uniref:Uncharacterized protein n=1 Tax=Bailinhaonella thermotolerans TaxID=1070861 RepID=A0A3A4AX60_9ACTN|nr:hypothetical protein [Bailinhaonella thermotolerans]RJL31974.1 hypothetical protein D5H75_16155 [Bailinhaonella thermotolerans]